MIRTQNKNNNNVKLKGGKERKKSVFLISFVTHPRMEHKKECIIYWPVLGLFLYTHTQVTAGTFHFQHALSHACHPLILVHNFIYFSKNWKKKAVYTFTCNKLFTSNRLGQTYMFFYIFWSLFYSFFLPFFFFLFLFKPII